MRCRKLVPFALMLLAACETKSIEEMDYAERYALASEIADRCRAYGIQDQSPQMMQCAEAELQSEVAKREGRARAVQGAALGMSAMGNSMQQNARAMQARNVNCTSQSFGTMVTTNCY